MWFFLSKHIQTGEQFYSIKAILFTQIYDKLVLKNLIYTRKRIIVYEYSRYQADMKYAVSVPNIWLCHTESHLKCNSLAGLWIYCGHESVVTANTIPLLPKEYNSNSAYSFEDRVVDRTRKNYTCLRVIVVWHIGIFYFCYFRLMRFAHTLVSTGKYIVSLFYSFMTIFIINT